MTISWVDIVRLEYPNATNISVDSVEIDDDTANIVISAKIFPSLELIKIEIKKD